MASSAEPKPGRSKFPPLYWLVVVFEFFERGSYYGVMSVLSVYLTDVLRFPKQDVGLIKGTIQPLLYFLPIVSGALADRFGYRRALLVAFGLLGTGYFLTSQATQYATVFLSLVVMGIGAGTFKPVISGTIARCTDETNSTLGFGIFYWSINLGAFVSPLLLVPYLKNNVGWDWVLIAAALGTGAMLLPTLILYREPPAAKRSEGDEAEAERPQLLQTLAQAFEIVYSPVVLLDALARRSRPGALLVAATVAALLCWGGVDFRRGSEATVALSERVFALESAELLVRVERNLAAPAPFALDADSTAPRLTLTLHDPDRIEPHLGAIRERLRRARPALAIGVEELGRYAAQAAQRRTLALVVDRGLPEPFRLDRPEPRRHLVRVASASAYGAHRAEVLDAVRAQPELGGLSARKLDELVAEASAPPFVVLFAGLLLGSSLVVLRLAPAFRRASAGGRTAIALASWLAVQGLLWSLHLAAGLSLFATILSAVIGSTVLSLYAIDLRQTERFKDHLRFVVMIFVYSGFWVLYFQMFDSVLWYVQAYVDASSLNRAVGGALAAAGLGGGWRFDVEHVTVINAGTIILLQIAVSTLVRKTRALPTMVVGIGLATAGMAILAISSAIWVFIAGIVIFSVGEMTAHPKFISYVGQTAPKSRVAMYMGYLFLYGVIGSSIGSVLGAKLYVRYVDELNQPRTLWLIFTGVGVATVLGLLIYDRLVGRRPLAAQAELAR